MPGISRIPDIDLTASQGGQHGGLRPRAVLDKLHARFDILVLPSLMRGSSEAA